MKLKKDIIEKVTWCIDEYCCETMEHALADGFILIEDGQVRIATRYRYKEGGDYVYYCPFCGKKIEII